MLICYLDESGNTGRRLDDRGQPFYLIAAVMVREDRVREMTVRLDELAARTPTRETLVEYHGFELFHGSGEWEGVSPHRRIREYAKALSVLSKVNADVFHASIDKRKLARRYREPPPPHMFALQFLAEKLDRWIRGQADSLSRRALLVADENREHEQYSFDLIRSMQESGGPIGTGLGINIPLGHIIDNIYFTPSERSRGIQLADLVAFVLNRHQRNKCRPSKDVRSDGAVRDLVDGQVRPAVRKYRALWP